MLQEALFSPAVTVIAAVPSLSAVTTPVEGSTDATVASLEAHWSAGTSSASFSFVTSAVSVSTVPSKIASVGAFLMVTPVTAANTAGTIAQTIATTRSAEMNLLIFLFINKYLSS